MSTKRLFDLIASKAMGIFFASCGGVLLVQFPSYYGTEVAFEANKVSATGTVVATSERQEYFGGGIATVSSITRYISKVRFQTFQDKSVEFITSSACSSRKDCDRKTVRVQYDPSVPNQARIYSDTTLNTRVGGYVMFSLVFFLLGIGLLVVDLGDCPTRSNQ